MIFIYIQWFLSVLTISLLVAATFNKKYHIPFVMSASIYVLYSTWSFVQLVKESSMLFDFMFRMLEHNA